MSKEIKALLLLQAKDEISDGFYPTYSSHGERHRELEGLVRYRYQELLSLYVCSLEDLHLVEETE